MVGTPPYQLVQNDQTVIPQWNLNEDGVDAGEVPEFIAKWKEL